MNINYKAAQRLAQYYDGPPDLEFQLQFLEDVCDIKREDIHIEELLLYR